MASLQTATHMIHPWNMSVVTLEYFLNSVHFGERDIFSVSERVNFVTKFIDEVLLFNAEAWDDNMPFLGTSRVGQKWTQDLAVKGPGGSKNNQKGKEQKPFQPQQRFQTKERKLLPGNVCHRFNFKFCPTQNDEKLQCPLGLNSKIKKCLRISETGQNFLHGQASPN